MGNIVADSWNFLTISFFFFWFLLRSSRFFHLLRFFIYFIVVFNLLHLYLRVLSIVNFLDFVFVLNWDLIIKVAILKTRFYCYRFCHCFHHHHHRCCCWIWLEINDDSSSVDCCGSIREFLFFRPFNFFFIFFLLFLINDFYFELNSLVYFGHHLNKSFLNFICCHLNFALI